MPHKIWWTQSVAIVTVAVVPFAGLDMYGLLHVTTKNDMIKATIKHLENYLKVANEQSKKHGQIANQVTVIFDMEGFNLRQYAWRPGMTCVTTRRQVTLLPCLAMHAWPNINLWIQKIYLSVPFFSRRTGHCTHSNVRGTLSGNSEDMLHNKWWEDLLRGTNCKWNSECVNIKSAYLDEMANNWIIY